MAATASSHTTGVPELSWRLDPRQSFSDFTIDIVRGNDIDTYHLHRTAVAFGSRRSAYLADWLQEHEEQHLIIDDLPPSAAALVPSVLDFTYGTIVAPMLSSATAAPLHFLAEYFDMDLLRQLVRLFVHTDISTSNMADYYRSASLLDDDALIAVIRRFCQSKLAGFAAGLYELPLFNKPSEPFFWLDVLGNTIHSDDAARIVLDIVQRHVDAMDGDLFQSLTDPLQRIPSALVQAFLQLEHVLVGPSSEASPLQERCVNALVRDWATIDSDAMQTFLARDHGHLLPDLLQRVAPVRRVVASPATRRVRRRVSDDAAVTAKAPPPPAVATSQSF